MVCRAFTEYDGCDYGLIDRKEAFRRVEQNKPVYIGSGRYNFGYNVFKLEITHIVQGLKRDDPGWRFYCGFGTYDGGHEFDAVVGGWGYSQHCKYPYFYVNMEDYRKEKEKEEEIGKKGKIKIDIDGEFAFVYSPFNSEFVSKIKRIGGVKWESSMKSWRIPLYSVDVARKILMDVYGENDIDHPGKIDIQITFLNEISQDCAGIFMFGKMIASAHSRDGGAYVGNDVILIDGNIKSGGSARKWKTIIEKGAVMNVHDVSTAFVDKFDETAIDVKIINENGEK